MNSPNSKGTGGDAGANPPVDPSVRAGGWRVRVPNSGLEVWLYDDVNREEIRGTGPPEHGFGGMPAGFPGLSARGLVVGYSLLQDDELDIAVHVGEPLTDGELSVGHWLEPQHAWLRLPSGSLCVESNDASQIGPGDPGDDGARIDVPPGDYRLTLYRVDHEALDRERREWTGPQEIVVLTPGGSASDAAGDLLPFEFRRDTAWVGKYDVRGRRADVLVWFADYWDTFVVNLDAGAVAKLELVPGSYIRTHVPDVGITLVNAYAESWAAGRRTPPPDGVDLSEYGYAALQSFGEWNGAEALFCRREKATLRVEPEFHNVWVSGVVEVMDAVPAPPASRAMAAAQLRDREYFDAGFLAIVLMDVLPEVADLDEFPLPDAIDVLDGKLAAMGLAPQGDMTWREPMRLAEMEMCARFYAGRPDTFVAIQAGQGTFEVIFCSERQNGDWIVTGFADEIERRIVSTGPDGLPVPHPRVRFRTMDESLEDIFDAHLAAVGEVPDVSPAPQDLEQCIGAFGRFLAVAVDGRTSGRADERT